jgi:hypothetical protein
MGPGLSLPNRMAHPGPPPKVNHRPLLPAAVALASAALLAGCGPRPPWPVQWLAESPLPQG